MRRLTVTPVHCHSGSLSLRFSTFCDADKIVLLDGGEIIATGTHEELMLRSSDYCEMVAGAFQRTDSEESLVAQLDSTRI